MARFGSNLMTTDNHAAAVSQLPPDWREVYEERCAIREYDGNFPRAQAERLALEEVYRMMRQGRTADKKRSV